MMNLNPLKRILRLAGVLTLPLMAANLININVPVSETLFDPCSNECVNLSGSAHMVGNGTLSNNTVHIVAQVDEHLVGTGVTIHPGVTLGEGAAAGSASLVLEDLEPWWVYMGVPARQYKKRDKRKLLEYD